MLNIYKMEALPKLSYIFNSVPIRRPRVAQTFWKEKKQMWKTNNAQSQNLLQSYTNQDSGAVNKDIWINEIELKVQK